MRLGLLSRHVHLLWKTESTRECYKDPHLTDEGADIRGPVVV